ncbi:MAG: TlyA family RNA methyltransferase [Oscillospiraceae bacterium]|jgi:23S rRNA (cytidine1920-2'-O)/16S rRNA (cytidine1409-2'-O)-methyltransferase|nr:TlyA family RNA methyltransferase [Oscillospiraceae bacterium]
MPAKKIPAWKRLVDEGWVQTRADAERYVLSGRVYAGDAPVRNAGAPLAPDIPLAVRRLDARYIAKGGYKLHAALDAFGLDVTGRVALDAGASTGGFTHCLVLRGCARVYAVDVGFGQLHGSLRAHPAVVNLERTNISDDRLLALNPAPDLGTVDLSYLSLRLAVPAFARVLRGQGELVCLVKPLFEIDDPQARRTGAIAPHAYTPLLTALCADLAAHGRVLGVTHSPVTGNSGTLEFFVRLALGSAAASANIPGSAALGAQIVAAVQAALALDKYKK